MQDDLQHLPAALAAAVRLDDPDVSAADRTAHLTKVAAAAESVREVATWLDGPAADLLAWTLYAHGGLSQDQVAKKLGYGQETGGRSVRAVQIRIQRERDRRIGDTAVLAVSAAKVGLVARITVDPPLKVSATAHAEGLARLHEAATADAAEDGTTEQTATALNSLMKLWGPADAGRMLGLLAHVAIQIIGTSPNTTDGFEQQ